MLAMNPIRQAGAERQNEADKPIYRTRAADGEVDYAVLRESLMKRFSKALAYLAR